MQKTRLGEYRDSRGIKDSLTAVNLSMADISRRAGHTNGTLTYLTIDGYRNNKKVLTELYRAGIPAAMLSLPDDLKEKLI